MGSRDPDFKDPAAEAAWIAARLSGSQATDMRITDGVGHYPHVEAPDETPAWVADFARKVAQAQPA